MTTKKVGRDDAQIAKDRSRAVQARKAQRSKTNNTKRPAAKGGRGRTRKVSSPSTEEASDSDEDSFLVDDDEELSVDEASSSEDEIIAMAKRSQAKRQVAKKQTISLEDSSSSSEDESLIGAKRKPPPRTKYLNNDTTEPMRPGNALDSSSENSSSDTDGEEGGGFLESPAFQKRKSKQAPHMIQRMKAAAKGSQKSKPPTSSNIFEKFKYNNNNKSKFAARKPAPAKMAQGDGGVLAQSTKASLQESDTDDDVYDIPVGRASTKRKRNNAFSNDDEDDSPVKMKANKKSSTEDSAFVDDDEDANMDEDEQTALAVALSQSAHEEEQSRKRKETQKVIDLEDSDESDIEEEQDANEEFVEEDAEAKTAATVLATANKLSLTVLKTMQILAKKASSDPSNKDDDPKGPVGMIVDGALALHDLASVNANDSNHDFISPELMKEICPNITLAGYQIIGVNWMALLHGMKVAVDGSKKKTNVNGVLADEMGLGKTAQTIVFLAWLKYKNQGIKPNSKGNDGNEVNQVVDLLESDDEAADDLDVDLDEDEEAYGEDKRKIHTPNDHVCPHLIVVPASVLSNWEREFKRFAPHLNVVKYHGSQAERFEMQETLKLHLPKNAKARRRAGVEPLDIILAPIT